MKRLSLRTLHSLFLATLVAGGMVFAGSPPPPTTISIPVPELPDNHMVQYHIVELAGATLVEDDLLVDGRLPKILINFTERLEGVYERLTIFENAVLVVKMEGEGWRMSKRVRIPTEALDKYRAFFTSDELERFRPWSEGDSQRDQTVLRIATGETSVERKWPSTAVIPEQIERLRLVLHDVLRALAEDREVTNPVTGYEASVGDVLLGDDQKSYKVIGIRQQGELLELQSLTEPVRRFVAKKDLHLYFVAAEPATP
ncbi:MAG: hypothetical protein ABR517_03850 [Thermoanaerobaculia bacterium]